MRGVAGIPLVVEPCGRYETENPRAVRCHVVMRRERADSEQELRRLQQPLVSTDLMNYEVAQTLGAGDRSALLSVVPREGLEPSRSCGHLILSLLCVNLNY